MGHFRFKKSIKIAPGLKLNFNKKSTSLTFGGKGAHYTINSKGSRTTSFGIPGTGISYVDTKKAHKKSSKQRKSSYQSVKSNSTKFRTTAVDNQPNQYNQQNFSNNNRVAPPNKKKLPVFQRTLFIIVMLLYITPVGLFLMWYFKEWKTAVKLVISIFFIFYFMMFCGAAF